MAVKIKKVQREIRFGSETGKVKTYGIVKTSGYCDMEKLCELVSARSAMSSADIKAILDSLNWVMRMELRSGSIVQLGEFGNFRLSVSTEGTETAKAFTASHVKKARILFSPGASLRDTNSRVTFETENEKENEEADCNREHAD
ncbi:MAG: HU family DNA-binding protein [Tannerellaceae bacterium]|nr:HU family DNA-binding protein [Tannerellaceae bacterium]